LGWKVCEFTVILDKKEVFKDVVYAKMEGEKVILRDVLGESLQLSKCRIVEIDVNSTRLVLSRL
jgi:predicted RNA-binding protein